MPTFRTLARYALLLLLLAFLGTQAWRGWVLLITGGMVPEGLVGTEAVHELWLAWGCGALFTYLLQRFFPPVVARCGLITLFVLLVLLGESILFGLRDCWAGQGWSEGIAFFAFQALLELEALVLLGRAIYRREQRACLARRKGDQGGGAAEGEGVRTGICEGVAAALFFPVLGLGVPLLLLLGLAFALFLALVALGLVAAVAMQEAMLVLTAFGGSVERMVELRCALIGGSVGSLTGLFFLYPRRGCGGRSRLRQLCSVLVAVVSGMALLAALAALVRAVAGNDLPTLFLLLTALHFLVLGALLPLLWWRKGEEATASAPPTAAPACTENAES